MSESMTSPGTPWNGRLHVAGASRWEELDARTDLSLSARLYEMAQPAQRSPEILRPWSLTPSSTRLDFAVRLNLSTRNEAPNFQQSTGEGPQAAFQSASESASISNG